MFLYAGAASFMNGSNTFVENKMVQLSSIVNDDFEGHPLLILQSSLAQNSLPVLRSVLIRDGSRRNVLFCLLYPPNAWTDPSASDEVYNWLDRVPRYNDADTHAEILSISEKGIFANGTVSSISS